MSAALCLGCFGVDPPRLVRSVELEELSDMVGEDILVDVAIDSTRALWEAALGASVSSDEKK